MFRASTSPVIVSTVEMAHENPFPVGFRFLPTEEELVVCYLKNKAMNIPIHDPPNRFRELELFNYTPEQLREIYGDQQERDMYFFVKKVLKFSTGKRLQRRTSAYGYWRASTKEIDIEIDCRVVGHRRTLVYHKGEGRGEKTNWLMYEYRLSDDFMLMPCGDWLLCKVYLNEKEKIKPQLDFILEPPAVPNSSSDVGQESALTSSFMTGTPQSSPFSSASQRTTQQSTTMINSGSSIQLVDSNEIVSYRDVTYKVRFDGWGK